MQKRMMRWLATLLVALAVGVGILAGGSRPTTAYGADPTPTPESTNSNPSGWGGGH